MYFMVIRTHRNSGFDPFESDGWQYTLLGFTDSEAEAEKVAAQPREWPKYAREVHIAIVPTDLISYPVTLQSLLPLHIRELFRRFIEVAQLKQLPSYHTEE